MNLILSFLKANWLSLVLVVAVTGGVLYVKNLYDNLQESKAKVEQLEWIVVGLESEFKQFQITNEAFQRDVASASNRRTETAREIAKGTPAEKSKPVSTYIKKVLKSL